ncbi:hypothetical protein CIG75_17455 [Tumebacillus algifaecis]|uniref:Uncharacterized protein n=1 Tax=Tumebacillus algifaecis TaxID=1214604 RepID=A0A223D549_9BACL|nr:DUF6731 family protein [Tumebacillus algifaecis]ASS76573.1 hypothetical protein CIG75_17455 [Tumebacillus algifaecis]
MANRSILIDFYRVSLPSGVKFKKMLEVAKAANLEDREFNVKDYPIRLEKIERLTDGNWLGHLVKIRMDFLPKKATKGQAGLEDLGLNPDQGIGEETSFMYNENTNVILYQRNYYGVRIEGFNQYMRKLYKDSKGLTKEILLEFLAIVGEDAFEKLERQQIIRKVDVRLALPDNPEIASKLRKNQVLNKWIDNLEDTGSETMSLTLSMGRKRNASMIVNAIKEAARIAVKEQDYIGKFKVRAKEDDYKGRLEWIDLLEDRIHENVELDVSRKEPLTHDRMSRELIKVWGEREEEINALFLIR